MVGAKVTLEAADRRLIRVVKGGGGYCSSGDRRILFGLGTATAAPTDCRVTVRWPGGAEQTWKAPGTGRYWRLREGESAPSEH
jgi:hypothetical protein